MEGGVSGCSAGIMASARCKEGGGVKEAEVEANGAKSGTNHGGV